jgi:hypothetical protein
MPLAIRRVKAMQLAQPGRLPVQRTKVIEPVWWKHLQEQ